MIKDIRHTGIVVSDLEASLYFYCNLFGFRIAKQMEEMGDYIDCILGLHEAKITTVKMTSPSGQLIELVKYHSHSADQRVRHVSEIGISHLAFTVDNLEAEYDRLKRMGVQFNSPPQLSPDGYAKVTFCRAPEGTLIELVETV